MPAGRKDDRFTSTLDHQWKPALDKDGKPDPTVPRGAAKYGARITAIERERRVEAVFLLLAVGNRRSHVMQFVTNSTDWDVAPRTVGEYITAAIQRFKEEGKRRYTERIGKGVAAMEEAMRRAIAAGDYGAFIRAQREIRALHGLGVKYQRADMGTGESQPPTETPPSSPAHNDQHRAGVLNRLTELARSRGANVPALDIGTPGDN